MSPARPCPNLNFLNPLKRILLIAYCLRRHWLGLSPRDILAPVCLCSFKGISRFFCQIPVVRLTESFLKIPPLPQQPCSGSPPAKYFASSGSPCLLVYFPRLLEKTSEKEVPMWECGIESDGVSEIVERLSVVLLHRYLLASYCSRVAQRVEFQSLHFSRWRSSMRPMGVRYAPA